MATLPCFRIGASEIQVSLVFCMAFVLFWFLFVVVLVLLLLFSVGAVVDDFITRTHRYKVVREHVIVIIDGGCERALFLCCVFF